MGAIKEQFIKILESGRWRGVQEFYGEENCTEADAKAIFYFWEAQFRGGLVPGYRMVKGKVEKVNGNAK